MIVKPYAGRNLLSSALNELELAGVQISEAAAVRLAQVVEAYGKDVARRALRAFLDENEQRRRLRIPQLKRLSDRAIEEALDGHGTDA
jgi:N-methylhydantoinase B/oxoprolinase/acetone carboxylase alpha subunit